jgi:hypothetical protein
MEFRKYMGLDHDRGHGFVSDLSGYTGLVFDQSFLGFFLAEVS